MKRVATIPIVLAGALLVGGCEAVMVANLVGNLLMPASPRFAQTQSGPFRERTATDEISPVLHEATGADITDKCKENLQKVQPTAGAEPDEGDPSEPAAMRPIKQAALEGDAEAEAAELQPSGCTRRWVCLPAQDYPLLATFCPHADVVEADHEEASPIAGRGEWDWDWDQIEYYE